MKIKYKILNKNNYVAAILEKNKKPLKLRNIVFNKLKRGQVLVKIIYSGVCKSQIMEIDGLRGKDHFLPHMLGHEGSGIVEGVGPGVKKVKKNDEVILTWIISKGIDANNNLTCKNLSDNSLINFGKVTTFSNYSVVSENRLVKKPKKLSFKDAAIYGCSVLTGVGLVVNEAKPKYKDVILIIGLGGIGINSLVALKSLGFLNIYVLDKNLRKKKITDKIGVKFLHITRKNKLDIQKKYNNFFDICYEFSGSTEIIELGFSLIKFKSGKIVFASHPKENEKIKLKPHDLIKGKKILGSWGGGSKPDRDILRFFNILRKNKYNNLLNKYMKVYKLKDINKAISDLKKGKILRPIIKMDN